MIDLDELEEAAKAALVAPGRLKYGYPTSPEETLALVRAARAALVLCDATPYTLVEPGFNEVAFEQALADLEAALAPFREDTA